MKRITALAAVALMLVALASAADDDERSRKQSGPTYESPVLTLLFLPVNLLIKMASVFGPDSSGRPQAGAPARTPTR
jgi:hypothetical protein